MELIIIILLCVLIYTQRKKINFLNNSSDNNTEEVVAKITKETLTKLNYKGEQYESFDNIQKAGHNLKNVARFSLYQIICLVLTPTITIKSFSEGMEEFGIGVTIVGVIISIYFTVKVYSSLLRAGNFLINHKTD